MKLIISVLVSFSSTLTFSKDPLPHGPSLETLSEMAQSNQSQARFDSFSQNLNTPPQINIRPFAEYEQTGYLFFNDENYFGYATEIKRKIAENLPEGVTLVVYTTSSSNNHLNRVRERYLEFIDESQLIVLQIPQSGSSDFWTRDNLPIPVWTDHQFTLVDARYYYNFEPDQFLANLFSTLKTQHPYFFEGGNFIANSRGECIVVNRRKAYPGGVSDTAAIPDSIFTNQYGCRQLIRFEHLKGIGHADEVVKFMSDDIIVTDTPEYVTTLENLGYEVHLLPEPDRNYETYVNSLQVNDVLFVPIFGESGDQEAVELYQNLNLGLRIVTIPTRRLAVNGQGGIHCITMNYPPAEISSLVDQLSATIISQ